MSGAHIFDLDGNDPTADGRALRDAFGCFTTGVTVVTTLNQAGERVGFTANSFASVSLDPPLALMCIGHDASCLPALEASGFFAINVLHVDQQVLSRQFTAKNADRFEGLTPEVWKTGAPIIPGCMANFDCETHYAFDAGDHRVFVGKVLKVGYDPGHEPLVFLRGGYRRVHTD
ncbi:flavin reductase (DIM6/NTAB) family NADH-FMN oxidoreductase RutF [Caulobacter ginsengisoli]|uniref:Flavin reductase (DIM6/NTAB) family NADH-FMN oxidoreductase RutF n=1 Tax=Caulobacter ginsengisoli TaxID=400775 RepID=A0ABU0J0P5_9CAUL|nr:flavin reductase family protein [Caulobacter ginsengisoli]MDQ0466787.1 flavin reductase (DIM6/NTAB) family NADH-FMN oxidoreductase RutF [Caulobacter ginsengisoli]